jgi:hypothetical protein
MSLKFNWLQLLTSDIVISAQPGSVRADAITAKYLRQQKGETIARASGKRLATRELLQPTPTEVR